MTQDILQRNSATALETTDEREIEAIAARLRVSAPVVAMFAECRARLLEDPAAQTPSGSPTLDAALDHLGYAACLGGANGDPSRPAIAWTLTAPRMSPAGPIPGSKYLIDNPDTVYRFATVDGVSSYRIDVSGARPGPAQFSFMLHDTMFSEASKKDLADLDQPIAGLRDLDIRARPDGSFSVTIDPFPADGRDNHIQSTGDARIVWLRNSLNRWGVQHPHAMRIVRTDGPDMPPPMDEAAMAQLAASILRGGTDWLLALMNRTFGFVAEPNLLSKPFGRGGAWGYAARGNFALTEDEALILSIAAPAVDSYLGVQLTDPWQVSLEYVDAPGSLNNHQAVADADGGFHFVVSIRDPGVANWLSTDGLSEGGILIRWQRLDDDPAVRDGTIRDCKVVKLGALADYLPPATRAMKSDERAAEAVARRTSYAHRYQPMERL